MKKIRTTGENYVLERLSKLGYKKLNIKVSKIRIERIEKNNYKREFWSFKNEKERINDFEFYILVCLNENNNIEKTFIVPSKKIGEKNIITIPRKSEGRLKDYKEKWDLI